MPWVATCTVLCILSVAGSSSDILGLIPASPGPAAVFREWVLLLTVRYPSPPGTTVTDLATSQDVSRAKAAEQNHCFSSAPGCRDSRLQEQQGAGTAGCRNQTPVAMDSLGQGLPGRLLPSSASSHAVPSSFWGCCFLCLLLITLIISSDNSI